MHGNCKALSIENILQLDDGENVLKHILLRSGSGSGLGSSITKRIKSHRVFT